jgi:hypothetical protein
MMAMTNRRLKLGVAAALIAASGIAAAGPHALDAASGGAWQVSHDARGTAPQTKCLAEPVLLGQWEHRTQKCERTILSDEGARTTIDYRCPDGGFGHSEITLLTPRTMRVATQGISAGAPFNYVIHARRVGNCPRR